MIFDTIIIGGGPAGITAAIYAARKGLKFVIISPDIGGQILKTSFVDNYTGYQQMTGPELVQKFEEHFEEFDFDFHQAEVNSIEEIKSKTGNIFQVKTGKEEFESKTLIITTGAEPRHLNIPGEKELRSRGLSYCTTCDGPLFRNKDVAIIGGGNSALESALHMQNIARQIYVVNINNSFTGDEVLIQNVEKLKNVEILHNTQTLEVVGESVVQGLKVKQSDQDRILDIQGVFVNIGYIPQIELVKDLVKLNKFNEIEVVIDAQTSHPQIFAAGDCTNGPHKQIITAAGAGANAALTAFSYLSRLK